MRHALLYLQQQAVPLVPLERWRQQGPDGSPHGAGLAPLQELAPPERTTGVQEGNKNGKAGVGNGRADGPFPSRRDGAACN
jgi:hypothetical protein